MKSTVLTGLLTMLAAVSIPVAAHAGAWEQQPGEAYAKVWSRGLFGSSAFTTEGDTVDTAPYTDVALNYYAEYGLPARFTLLTSGQPLGFASYDDNSTTYVGPLDLGLRRSFLEGPFRLGIQAQYGYQGLAGDEDLAAGTTPEGLVYRPAVAAHFGQLSTAFGYGAGWGWVSIEAGMKAWSREIPFALVGMVQVGFTLVDWLTFDIHFPFQQHFEPITVINVPGTSATNYQGFGLGVSFAVTESIGITGAFEGAAATSNASTPSLLLGVEWKIR